MLERGGQTPATWINPEAFAIPANGTWGNAGRNLVRAPGLWQIDTALTKRHQITEHLGIEFRAEAFNLLNHSQFGLPNANISALGSFGKITQRPRENRGNYVGSGAQRGQTRCQQWIRILRQISGLMAKDRKVPGDRI